MEKFIGKKYKQHRTENFEELLTAMKVNMIMRKIIKNTSPVIQLIKKDDGSYLMNTTFLMSTTTQKFVLGEEADFIPPDGRKMKVIYTIEGNKLIEKQIGENALTVVRDYHNDQMITTTSFGTIVSTSWFKLVTLI